MLEIVKKKFKGQVRHISEIIDSYFLMVRLRK